MTYLTRFGVAFLFCTELPLAFFLFICVSPLKGVISVLFVAKQLRGGKLLIELDIFIV